MRTLRGRQCVHRLLEAPQDPGKQRGSGRLVCKRPCAGSIQRGGCGSACATNAVAQPQAPAAPSPGLSPFNSGMTMSLAVRFQEPKSPVPPTVITTDARVIVIGDIHGDINKAMACLELAGVASFHGGVPRWTGGNTVVVQLGDILDRGDVEIATVMLLRELDAQANEQDGAIHILNGNHESLNVCGDFRYVTAGAFVESGMVMGMEGPDLQDLKKLVQARLMLYTPGGAMAKELSKNPTVLVVNDSVFAHGGLLPEHVEYGIEKINAEVAAWMRRDQLPDGGFAAPPFMAIGGKDAVMWNRTFGNQNWKSYVHKLHATRMLEATLAKLGCERLIVGHTPQKHGANSDISGKVWRMDVGLSRNMLNAQPCVLELGLDVFGKTVARLID